MEIISVRLGNALDIRAYLGEDRYNDYVMNIADELRKACRQENAAAEMYFERPGFIYLMLEDAAYAMESMIGRFIDSTRERLGKFADIGVRFDPRICLIRFPEDLRNIKDILNLGHKFPSMGLSDRVIYRASDIVNSRTFEIINNMESILNRAMTENRLEMYYQPIYNIRTKTFQCAEALARLNDSQYGSIPPAAFIPAAENMGLILAIGDMVLESVFRFISQHDLKALGLDYIEINLSVAQCLQSDLPEVIERLQKRYGVSPGQVNFEITETLFDNIGNVMEKNIKQLSEMGYSFSLDDYGIGYSNIQRLSRLPLSIIKIDKSMVDEMFSQNGQVIIQNTVRMMQGIHKQLVVEGVETEKEKEALIGMSCDYIQGFTIPSRCRKRILSASWKAITGKSKRRDLTKIILRFCQEGGVPGRSEGFFERGLEQEDDRTWGMGRCWRRS